MASSPTPTSPRRRIVGVSTKMYFSFSQTQSYIASVLEQLGLSPPSDQQQLQSQFSSSSSPLDPSLSNLLSQIDIFIIPDHISLATSISQLRGTPILLGAQDAYHEDRGAYTGFTSPAVLAEVGCRIVELGHAERRRLLGETDADAARKAAAAVRNGMWPLVCIGERTRTRTWTLGARNSATATGGEGNLEEQKEEEMIEEMIEAAVEECRPQVEAVMTAVPDDAVVILAYEPVWAIGAPAPAASEHVNGVARGIRELECVKRRREGATRILYGGSAGPGLFAKLKDGGLDGLFLGRFAHDPAQFVRTIREVAEA